MATVEAELRQDIRLYEDDGLDPLSFAVRIRLHPTLAVTARNKRLAAVQHFLSYDDKHRQTFKFYHQKTEWLDQNWQAGTNLLAAIENIGINRHNVDNSTLYFGVPVETILNFISSYQIHEDHPDLNPKLVRHYIVEQNRLSKELLEWNVGVIQPKSGEPAAEGLGPIGRPACVSRARLAKIDGGTADIKALMTRSDIAIDLPDPSTVKDAGWSTIKAVRASHEQSRRPLLLLYPIDRNSEPRSNNGTREKLGAVRDVLGLGYVFPKALTRTPVGYITAPLRTESLEDLEYEPEEI
jgi:hypothetical protein